MTVQQLIEALSAFNPDQEVNLTWEGTFQPITIDSIYVSADGFLILDADNNEYKEEITTIGTKFRSKR